MKLHKNFQELDMALLGVSKKQEFSMNRKPINYNLDFVCSNFTCSRLIIEIINNRKTSA